MPLLGVVGSGSREGRGDLVEGRSRRGRRSLARILVTLNLGILLALACAVATQLGFLYKHKGANAAPCVDVRHPLRSGRALFASRWFALGMAVAARRLDAPRRRARLRAAVGRPGGALAPAS